MKNVERLSEMDDAHDILFSEIFVAFEILMKELHAYVNTTDESKLPLWKIAEALRVAGVITPRQKDEISWAVSQRNRLFHGDPVAIRKLPIKRLKKIVEDMRWYFVQDSSIDR